MAGIDNRLKVKDNYINRLLKEKKNLQVKIRFLSIACVLLLILNLITLWV